MKKIFALTFLILALFAATCSAEKSSPEEDINLICKAVLHGEAESLQRIGITPEEYRQFFISEFSKSLVSSSGINFSENQILRINDAVMEVFKRIEFYPETISQNGDYATVKITVSQYEKFDENLVLANIPANIDSMSQAEKIDAFVDAVVAALQNLKIAGYTELSYQCQYLGSDDMWVPIQAKEFGALLIEKIFVF